MEKGVRANINHKWIGKTFGRLQVIKRARDKQCIDPRRPYWVCQCKCDSVTIVRGDSLRAGTTQSCGCLLQRDR